MSVTLFAFVTSNPATFTIYKMLALPVSVSFGFILALLSKINNMTFVTFVVMFFYMTFVMGKP